MADSINLASQAIFAENRKLMMADGREMSTTKEGIKFYYGDLCDAIVFNVGGNRVYLCRNRRSIQLTADQAARQE